MSDPAVEALLESARAGIERGEPYPAEFIIPTAPGWWRLHCADLVAAGDNDLGIPPRAFAYGAVGMLVASLGASACYAMEPAMSAAPRTLSMAGQSAGASPAQHALVVSAFRRGRLEVYVQSYLAQDDGTLAWAEPVVRSTTEPTNLGSVVPLWRAVNREPSPLPPPEQLIDDMTDSGFVIQPPPR